MPLQTKTNDMPESRADPNALRLPSGKELVELCAALLDDDDFVAGYVLKSEKVKRAAINEYLRGFTRTPPVMAKGAATLAPRPKAKTLEEARKLCESYLGGL